tara:strand:+ start:68068 stop:68355 length:288 start_codon:yes stop_codon:yes gene_type:complete
MTDSKKKEHCCDELRIHLSAGEVAINYVPRFREYGIRIVDRGTSKQLIKFCPWCGHDFPDSLRDEWFDRLDDLGLEPDDPGVPEAMKSDKWWASN